MIVNPTQTVHIFHVPSVATGMDNNCHRLDALGPPQTLCNPHGKHMAAAKVAEHARRLGEVETHERLQPSRIIKAGRVEYGVKGHRQPWRGAHDPAKAAIDVADGTAERAVFEL